MSPNLTRIVEQIEINLNRSSKISDDLKSELVGKDVIIESNWITGPKARGHKGRRAKIVDAYFDRYNSGNKHPITVELGIYRLDNKIGWNGREEFIDGHYYCNLHDVKLI